MSDKRATCLNCMDGRVQLPVIHWIKETYHVDFVDIITEAGMDGVLSNEEQDISLILQSIGVSMDRNKSKMIFIVGHHDCRGNPVGKEIQIVQICKSVERLKKSGIPLEIIGLWVNEQWNVEKVEIK